jgi:hypothetical protein
MHEEIRYPVVNRNGTLQVTRRLEMAHHLSPDPCRPVRVFRAVVQPFVLAMFDVDPQIRFRRRVALELVGDRHLRRTTVLLEQFAHQAPGRVSVAPASAPARRAPRHVVHRTPQPVLLPVDRDDHLIKVPLVASSQSSGPYRPDNAQVELHRPALHCLVRELALFSNSISRLRAGDRA